ncbi:cysteine-rich CWC family protein [Hahella ganghwensis]|uniref:cysteine-rich CWC family protein n=1 Tax=Hahella ganghwensis TaxID=286420 RepID=UPI000A05890F
MEREQQRKQLPNAYTHSCPSCGKPAQCDLEKGKSSCWCFTLPHSDTHHEPYMEGNQCYCRSCLTAMRSSKTGVDKEGS